MMGPNDPSPPADPRQRQTNRSTDESSSCRRSAAKEVNAISTGVHSRTERNEPASRRNKTQIHSHKVPEAKSGPVDVLADFQNALMNRERELEKERAEYRKMMDLYNQLLAINKIQDDAITEREATVKSLTELFDIAVSSHLFPYAQKHGLDVEFWTHEAFLEVFASLAKDANEAGVNATDAITYAAEVSSLTEQVRTLQKEMLAKVEKIHVASDEQFAQEFRVIASLIKSLSRTIRINETLDVVEILGYGPVLKDVSKHHWTGRAKKKCFVEAWIWSALIQLVFRTPFAILGKQCDSLYTDWQSMFMTGHCNGWPIPTSLSETWRYTTMESMLNLVDQEILTHGKEKDMPKSLEAAIIAKRKDVINGIGVRLAKVSTTPITGQQVSKIVDKAYAFAMQMALQRVRLQITYPKPGDKSNADTMSFLPDPEGDDIDGELVAFIVNPGLTKWGDAHGKNLDHRYDIVPSLVQLETSRQEEAVKPKPAPQGWAAVVRSGLEGASKGDRNNGGESRR
jgi:hypothetical protein